MMSDSRSLDRRNFLVRAISAAGAGIMGTLAVILGGAVVSPGFARRPESWVPAGGIGDLEEGVPTPVTIRVAREDGYYHAFDREVVFLVKTGEREVRALSSTCTHLGCRVSWDAAGRSIKCPCHGGVFNVRGEVQAGPPPRSLPSVPARLDGDTVLIQL